MRVSILKNVARLSKIGEECSMTLAQKIKISRSFRERTSYSLNMILTVLKSCKRRGFTLLNKKLKGGKKRSLFGKIFKKSSISNHCSSNTEKKILTVSFKKIWPTQSRILDWILKTTLMLLGSFSRLQLNHMRMILVSLVHIRVLLRINLSIVVFL
jgi:hypothetical protein